VVQLVKQSVRHDIPLQRHDPSPGSQPQLTCSLHALISQEGRTVKETEVTARRTQAQRRAATRQALIDSGRALFAQQGFAGVGREEIVARAGVTRGAMYHYFPSKEDLFQAVYETVEQDLLQAVAEAASADTDPVSQLRLGTEAFLRSAATEEIRRISLIDAPAVLSKRTRRQLDEQYGLGLVREALTAVHAAGRLRVGPPAVLAPLLLAAMHEAATQIADGAAAAQIIATVDDLIGHITAPP
jgi:AcrR family transcriptional regulator